MARRRHPAVHAGSGSSRQRLADRLRGRLSAEKNVRLLVSLERALQSHMTRRVPPVVAGDGSNARLERR